jgi:hypothetical protein
MDLESFNKILPKIRWSWAGGMFGKAGPAITKLQSKTEKYRINLTVS